MSSARVSRAVSVALGPGPAPTEVLRRARGWDGLLCLHGEWADAQAVLASHPTRVETGAAALSALDDQPAYRRAAAGELDETSVPAPPGAVCGGWFGWFGADVPARIAWHDHVLRHVDGAWFFEALWTPARAGALCERLDAWRAVLAGDAAEPAPWRFGPFAGPVRDRHLAAVERAVELVRAGELYQVNVCTRLSAPAEGDAVSAFADLCDALAPVHGAYVAGDGRSVVSLSPELFLRRRGHTVVTSPIKGTVPRTGRPDDDGRAVLRRSTKDAAENVMIVDLMRNDLGRVCRPGTVRATALLGVQAHPGVWHLVSSVEGQLREDVGDTALLRATFPPGSVTGTPKLRALDAIAVLEDDPRGVYTGAIGYASAVGGTEFSVAIRTFEIVDGRVDLGVGGGITADSVPMLEWRECLHKAAPLLRAAATPLVDALREPDAVPSSAQLAGGLLETVLCTDGVPLRLPDHLARLDRSCREIYGAGLPEGLTAKARDLATTSSGRAALRVIARPGDRGSLAVELHVRALPGPAPAVSDLCVATRSPGSWRHKWADRGEHERAEAAHGPRAPLYVGTDGAVLETSRGNVFLIEDDGTLVMPPLRDDLLPGVTRRALLDLARDTGRPTRLRAFGVAELLARPAFWTSSLSGAVVIASVDGRALPRADADVARWDEQLRGGTIIR